MAGMYLVPTEQPNAFEIHFDCVNCGEVPFISTGYMNGGDFYWKSSCTKCGWTNERRSGSVN